LFILPISAVSIEIRYQKSIVTVFQYRFPCRVLRV